MESKARELFELKEPLNSTNPQTRKEAIQRVVAVMAFGQDVSNLFPHIIKCIDTSDIQTKKLVYLYIINYAKTQPELAILAVNSFIKDARNPTSPLIRALAVRTMGYIQVAKISEYLCEVLKECLKDDDPYVRKTAVICVSKLYDIAPNLFEDSEFFNILVDGLYDANPLVVSNVVAVLDEINKTRGESIVNMNFGIVDRLLDVMNECSEWGQVFILDFIVGYTPMEHTESESIIAKVIPQLAHSNPAVITGAIKVVTKLLDLISSAENLRKYLKRLAGSLITLLNTPPELLYVSLRLINAILTKRPGLLEKKIEIFLCRYNDPFYIKHEKLEIIVKLFNDRNGKLILNQLEEYATEIDIEFAKKALESIGRCARKIPSFAKMAVSILMQINELGVTHSSEEVIVVMRDVVRKYPGKFDDNFIELISNLTTITGSDAKSAYIWGLGQYMDRIPEAESTLKFLAESFIEEPVKVQFSLLTSLMKLFLRSPSDNEELITNMFRVATTDCLNPDLRDRAYIYWKILSVDPEAAKSIVFCEQPPIVYPGPGCSVDIPDNFIEELGNLSSVYNKPFSIGGPKKNDKVSPIDRDYRAVIPMEVVLDKDTIGTGMQYGLQVEAAFQCKGNTLLDLRITNWTNEPVHSFAMQFNKNYFGIALAEPIQKSAIAPGNTMSIALNIELSENKTETPPEIPLFIQTAFKCNLDIFYFQIPCILTALLCPQGQLTQEQFRNK